jgi:hypothetical protein
MLAQRGSATSEPQLEPRESLQSLDLSHVVKACASQQSCAGQRAKADAA